MASTMTLRGVGQAAVVVWSGAPPVALCAARPLLRPCRRSKSAVAAAQHDPLPEPGHWLATVPRSLTLPTRMAATCATITMAALATPHPVAAELLDAAGAHALSDVLRPTIALLTFLYIVRIPMTWYPTINGREFPWYLAVLPTEPVLAATRKVIPLVGGVDITPIIWVGLLSFFNEILLGPQGLLVLIERQGGI